jgi:hypothetical protein
MVPLAEVLAAEVLGAELLAAELLGAELLVLEQAVAVVVVGEGLFVVAHVLPFQAHHPQLLFS